jgi:hypothetical protein
MFLAYTVRKFWQPNWFIFIISIEKVKDFYYSDFETFCHMIIRAFFLNFILNGKKTVSSLYVEKLQIPKINPFNKPLFWYVLSPTLKYVVISVVELPWLWCVCIVK